MPSKLPRLNVTFPNHALHEMVKRDAELNERSESSQIIWALKQYYAGMKKQVELFNPPQLREATQVQAPIFETPDPQVIEPALRRRAGPGREKS